MGQLRPFVPARLVIGVLLSCPERMGDLLRHLEVEFGPVERVTDPVPFLFTDYYNEEMGIPIERLFIVFERLVDPSTLSVIKLVTNRIEDEFAVEGKRRINLDPGILSSDNFILATTKNRSHRIPLEKGIFGEVTLIYTKGAFQSLPWTYADYRSDAFKALFKEFRSGYLATLKHIGEKQPV